MRYKIWGSYPGIPTEQLDEASSEAEAKMMVAEYTLAFKNWRIWYT